MKPGIRKVALTAHVVASVGWLGAIAGFECLAVTGLANREALIARAAYLAMERIAWFVIVPFAFASLMTGLVMSLGTKWGLFRHYWVLAKFLVNSLAIILLLLHTRLIGVVANAAAEGTLSTANLGGRRIQLVAVAGAALLALLGATMLAVFKPRGMTPYGHRKQKENRREASSGTPNPQMSAAPANETAGKGRRLAAKISFAVLCVIILAFVVLHLTVGGHGSHGH